MMLPLVGSLGIAEWQIYRLRSRAVTALRQSTSVAGFRVLARSELVRAVLRYSAALVVLTCAVVIMVLPQPELLFVLSTCAYGVLGLAFFLETLLLSLGRHRLALGLALATLVIDSVLRWALALDSPEAVAAMHLSVFVALLLIVLPAAELQYTSAGVHR